MTKASPSYTRLARSFDGWLVMALCLVPLIFVPVPPLVDLTPHAIRMYLVAYVPQESHLWKFYSFSPTFTPNLGFDALVYSFAALGLGIRTALTLAMAGTTALMGLGIALLSRALHGRVTAGAALATIFVFAWPMQMGFLNYVVSLGLALIGVTLHLHLRHRSLTLYFAVLLPVSCLTWMAHLVGWGVLGLGVLGCEIARLKPATDDSDSLVRAGLRLTALSMPVPLTLFWFSGFTTGDAGSNLYWDFGAKLTYAATQLKLRWPVADLVTVAVCAGLVFWVLIGRHLRAAHMALWAGGLLIMAFVLLPTGLGTTYFLDRRLLMPSAILICLSMGMPRSPLGEPIAWLMRATACLYVLLVILAWEQLQQQIDADRDLLRLVPKGSRVLALHVHPCGSPFSQELWTIPRSGAGALTLLEERDSFVTATWDLPDSNGLAIEHARTGRWNNISDTVIRAQGCPKENWIYRPEAGVQEALAALPKALFDYVWVTGPGAAQQSDVPEYRALGNTPRGTLYEILN